MRTAADEAGARTVETDITYVARDSKINRRFVAPGVECNTGRYETHRVPSATVAKSAITSAWMCMASCWRTVAVQ